MVGDSVSARLTVHPFEYHAPGDLEEALRLARAADDGSYLAGGMTLLPALKQRLAQPTDLIDLSGIRSLSHMQRAGNAVTLGAMCTHAEVAAAPLVRDSIPALAALAGAIGDPQVRNRGTLGGAVANNDPAADYPAGLLALDATVITDRREIQAGTFFAGMFETALQPGELITGCRFDVPRCAAYAKFSHPASRYAIVGVFVARFAERIRVAVTGAAPCVYRVAEMEAALGERFDAQAIARTTVDARGLNEDPQATAAYRAHLVTVLAGRAVAQCLNPGA